MNFVPVKSSHLLRGTAAAMVALVFSTVCGHASMAERRTPVVTAVEKTLPSVVNIGTERLVRVFSSDPQLRFREEVFDRFFRDFFDNAGPGYQVSHSLGSGVILDEEGYILTNFHVIQRASKISVKLANEQTYIAEPVAGDPILDIALIRIHPDRPLQAIELAADNDLLLGETVVALGNPFGLEQSVTVGVLSARNREARYNGEVLYRDILQTDAAVNPGSSGGPLINIEGRMIGLNVAIHREAQNIGFAVPVRHIRAQVAAWLSPRHLKTLQTGFEAADSPGGVVVSRVESGGPAEKAGLRTGARLRAINGRAVGDVLSLHRALLRERPGSELRFETVREGQTRTLSWRATDMPKPSSEHLARQRLGLTFAKQGEDGSDSGRAPFYAGLPIADVARNSTASRAGLTAGLRITRINDVEIHTLDDVGQALEAIESGQPVSLLVVQLEAGPQMVLARSRSVVVQAD